MLPTEDLFAYRAAAVIAAHTLLRACLADLVMG